jgi:hypothetical protein
MRVLHEPPLASLEDFDDKEKSDRVVFAKTRVVESCHVIMELGTSKYQNNMIS